MNPTLSSVKLLVVLFSYHFSPFSDSRIIFNLSCANVGYSSSVIVHQFLYVKTTITRTERNLIFLRLHIIEVVASFQSTFDKLQISSLWFGYGITNNGIKY